MRIYLAVNNNEDDGEFTEKLREKVLSTWGALIRDGHRVYGPALNLFVGEAYQQEFNRQVQTRLPYAFDMDLVRCCDAIFYVGDLTDTEIAQALAGKISLPIQPKLIEVQKIMTKKDALIDENRHQERAISELKPNAEGLLPCPFCGSSEVYSDDQQHMCTFAIYYVTCDECGCNGPDSDDKDSAIAAWNRRDAPTTWIDRLARVAEEIASTYQDLGATSEANFDAKSITVTFGDL